MASQDGLVHSETTMRVDPIFNGVKLRGEVVNPERSKTGRLYLGSVDPLTAQNWAKECGAAVGTKEFAAYAKKKLQSGEFNNYKAPVERRIFHGYDL